MRIVNPNQLRYLLLALHRRITRIIRIRSLSVSCEMQMALIRRDRNSGPAVRGVSQRSSKYRRRIILCLRAITNANCLRSVPLFARPKKIFTPGYRMATEANQMRSSDGYLALRLISGLPSRRSPRALSQKQTTGDVRDWRVAAFGAASLAFSRARRGGE